MEFATVLIKMVSALAVVLGLMALAASLARRYLGNRIGLSGNRPPLKIKGILNLGAKREIALVEVEGHYLVVGVTPAQISLLTRIERPGKGDGKSPEIPEAM